MGYPPHPPCTYPTLLITQNLANGWSGFHGANAALLVGMEVRREPGPLKGHYLEGKNAQDHQRRQETAPRSRAQVWYKIMFLVAKCQADA